MNGWPVWLASASVRDRRGRIISALRWGDELTAAVSDTLTTLLEGVGDPTREREFRMCITLCRHRALTEREHEALPGWWHDAPAVDIAGGPVEVLWHKNIPHVPSTMPCENPGREAFSPDPLLWLPKDCGRCGPCVARAACHAR